MQIMVLELGLVIRAEQESMSYINLDFSSCNAVRLLYFSSLNGDVLDSLIIQFPCELFRMFQFIHGHYMTLNNIVAGIQKKSLFMVHLIHKISDS